MANLQIRVTPQKNWVNGYNIANLLYSQAVKIAAHMRQTLSALSIA